MFDLNEYFNKIKKEIIDILNKKQEEKITFDILDTKTTLKHKLIILKEKQKQMKIGFIWQIILGNYKSFKNLGSKDKFDIISKKRKIIELKNRTNTDNSSSRKSNFDKLANFKKENPDYLCVYGTINDTTEKKTLKGFKKLIIHNDTEIYHYCGMKLLKLIFIFKNENIIFTILNYFSNAF